MLYREHTPDPQLQHLILNYWIFQAPSGVQHAEPIAHVAPTDGAVSLVLYSNPSQGLRHSLLQGPTTTLIRTMVYPDSVCLGIRAMPGMAGTVFGVEAQTLRNRVEEGTGLLHLLGLEGVLASLHPLFSEFAELDGLLKLKLPLKPEAADQEVQKAVSAIIKGNGQELLATVKKQAGIGERQLQKRFLLKTGMSMKEFSGTCRLRATLIEAWVHQNDLLDTLYNNGYYDQAHFLDHLKKISQSNSAAFKAHVAKIQHQGIAPYAELLKKE